MKNMKNVFGLALVASCGLAMPVLAQVAETEPNETKANADTVGVINLPAADGPALSGNTTGTSTTVPGAASADTFRVRTAAMAPGIYRNRLIITTAGTAGHTGTLRGLNQTSVGVIGTTDTTLQTSSTATTPARYNQWYTFGAASDMYYRVTGGTTTTTDYVVNYEVAPVTTIPVVGTITAGNVTITETGSIDADYWVYDSNFNPIPGFGIDTSETTGVTRSMTPGTYYLAMSRFNGANNLASAAPETFAGSVLDFPGAFSCSSTGTSGTAIPVFTSSSGTVTASTTTYAAGAQFDVTWYQFTVSAPTNPLVNSVIATPASGGIGSTTTIVANVSPAPDNAAITGVSLDATQIDAGTVTLLDNGVAPDVAAGDNNWTANVTVGAAATLGSKTLTATATDAAARTASGTGNFNVVPANDNCANGTALNNVGPFPYNVAFNTTGATLDGTWTGCSTFTPTGPDLWYTFTAPSDGILALSTCIADTGGLTTRDTLLGIATACGSSFVVCEDDESGTCGLASKIDLTVNAGNVYYVSVRSYSTTAITDGLMQVNFIPGTPLSVSNITTSNATIFTNDAPFDTVVTAQVTPASLPPSTGVSVSIDASAAGLGTITMLDNGVAPDATANDGIYSATLSSTGATLGVYNFPVNVVDAELRTASGTFAQTIDQTDEAGETIATAAILPDVNSWNARFNNTTDVDIYRVFICDPAAFSATTVGGITPPGTATGSDTSLYLFKPDGTGVSFNDDVSGTSFNSTLDNTQVLVQGPGEYYLAVAYFANDPFDTSALEMWLDTPFTGTRAPDGAGAAGSLGDWVGTGTVANYTVTLTGASVSGPCGPVCNDIDFNNDGSLFDPQDIDAFLSVYSEGPCIPDTATCDGIDFNNDTSVFDPCDISSFLQVFSEGPCELCPI